MQIGTIKEIWRYPVKSLFGERVQQAAIERAGFADDRCWAIRDDESGEFIGGKKIPKLMLLKARYLDAPRIGFGPAAQSRVEIEFPDGRRVNSDDPLASAILSMFVGRRVSLCPRPAKKDKAAYRLARPMSPNETRMLLGMKPSDPDPDFSSFSLNLLTTLAQYATPPGTLYDVYPLHFLTTASLVHMQEVAPEADFRVERYRPSFVIDTAPELRGLVERDWRDMDLQIGDALIRCNHPTIRCSMPGAAQPGIDKDPKVLQAVMNQAEQHFGAYATPHKPCQIKVGDVVELRPRSGGRLRASLDRIGRSSKGQIIKASNHIGAWQEQRAEKAATKNPDGLPKSFHRFELVKREQEATGIVSFWFADPARKTLPRFVPGQHLILALPQDGENIAFRPYTISGVSSEHDQYRISVKRESDDSGVGRGSGQLHDQLKEGDSVAIKDPGGQFGAVPSDQNPLLMISAGIGITPFLAILQAVASTNPQRELRLIHGIRRPEDFAFASELQDLQQQLPNLQLQVFVSQPGATPLATPLQAGRINIAELLSADAANANANANANADILLCGKPAFSKAMHDALLTLGVDASRLHFESFGASLITDHADQSRYKIHYTRSQRKLEWDPDRDSLLEFTELNDIPAQSSCRYGACQACEATLLSGEVHYPPEVQPPAGKNKVLLCSARPASDLEIEL